MLRKLVLPAVLLLGMNANASERESEYFGHTGLIGVEVGYMGTEYQSYNGIDINNQPILEKDNKSSASLGLKMGGESEFYRVFVEGRYWSVSPYNDAFTIGGALQYLIPLNNKMNIFLGINGGAMYLDSASDPYAGGDAGMNFDLTETMYLEAGARYSNVFIDSDEVNKVDYFYQAYVSIIFKFTGAY
ncbi:MAG: hypothetical protein DRG24_01125 [Epsilonproteobacteria bacterium]|nr:MAG: hypothetical protein DRG24_01125 [Campylobacterota bacterium]